MNKEEIKHGLENFQGVHLDVDDFAQNLIEAYIHTLFDQVEKEHGIRENFCAFNYEILESLAQAINVIIYGLESSSNNTERLKEYLIKLLDDYYIDDNER
jgi:hypothetical protein